MKLEQIANQLRRLADRYPFRPFRWIQRHTDRHPYDPCKEVVTHPRHRRNLIIDTTPVRVQFTKIILPNRKLYHLTLEHPHNRPIPEFIVQQICKAFFPYGGDTRIPANTITFVGTTQ